ncbi:hypothetical protein [Streptomyces rubellomurinus]|uniref:Uncharacterized protein n=2 Tax=Streptomyces TaxID=1883 RepID=A0A0F2TK98_STRR3|nr:hypothetical protein [Streptomyces rubellomurinus]KJS54454.1 hypothetical protein VM98_18935 [Streptomyces rubellomurinus subsp. indigoferus]KJS63564.1 hypothetical protein VM95_01425 [Streptomyces rubellomurinus]
MALAKTLGALGTASVLALSAVGAFTSAAHADSAAQPALTAYSGTSSQTVTSPELTLQKASDTPAVHSNGITSGNKPANLACGDFAFSGPYFWETCSGPAWQPFIDCSDGNEYVANIIFHGLWRVRLTCPVGYATGGGAFDLS